MSEPMLAEMLGDWLAGLVPADIPATARRTADKVLLDIMGLAIAARGTDYADAVIAGWSSEGRSTILGHAVTMDPAGAALVNGTLAHGEDFDDTFEGAPLHAGASAVPALLAACEAEGRSGADLLLGMVAGIEIMCRLAMVSPGAIHKAGFQPAAVLGCIGAAAGIGVALGLDRRQLVNALGLAGSFSSGLMEFLAEGAWTKRIHPGWAGQAGLRAVTLARAGFVGPRTVFEGRNGFYRAFARIEPDDLGVVTDRLGETWLMEKLAFKLYPCGTMIGPYIDCARMARADGIRPEDVVAIECRVAEGVAARQWAPLADKQRPPNGFAAKFSAPFGIALGLVRGEAGLAAYSDETANDPLLLATAAKVSYTIDPDNPFPARYTGDVEFVLTDGTRRTYHQPHLRGGRDAPVSYDELLDKFHANIAHGGCSEERGRALAAFCAGAFDAPDLTGLAAFGG